MSLDGTHFDPEPDLAELQPGKEGLRQLSYLLRHPEKWPEEHEWDFNTVWTTRKCGTAGCAIGLVNWKWGNLQSSKKLFPAFDNDRDISVIFGTSRDQDGEVTACYGVPMKQVTEIMVADAIDHFLATGRVPVAGEATP